MTRNDELPDADPDMENELPASALLESLDGDPKQSRMTGSTEHNWCKTVSGGTGVTVLAMRMQAYPDAQPPPSPSALQTALRSVQEKHPLLRSRLVWIRGSPALSVSRLPFIELSVFPAPPPNSDTEKIPHWIQIVESELNANSDWVEKNHCLDPVPMITARLYVDVRQAPPTAAAAPTGSSVLVLRLHTAVCDRASAITIYKDLLLTLKNMQDKGDVISNGIMVDSSTTQYSAADGGFRMSCIEDLIPKAMADKPFWAHGIDILGYSLGSRRHAMIPFKDTHLQQRRSQILCRKLTARETRKLLQDCSEEKTNLLGALTAAVLKATIQLKNFGDGISENHAVVTFVNCRASLDPVLPATTVGFYHSAILNTHAVRGGDGFWEIARKCSSTVEATIRRRKHFTDMGNLGMLMCQAMQMPQLTPFSSLRTATLALFHDLNVLDSAQDSSIHTLQQEFCVQETIGCSSVHGVGPSMAIFHSVQNEELHLNCVYPSPLHSHDQITQLLSIVMSILM